MTTTLSVDWIDSDAGRVARAVPADVLHAIEAYELAMARRQAWNKSYVETRWQHALDRCQVNGRLAEWWWQRLGDLLPMEAGWYPVNGMLYGYAKRSKCGFELTRKPGSEPLSQPQKAAAWRGAMAERRRAKEQLEAFCNQTR